MVSTTTYDSSPTVATNRLSLNTNESRVSSAITSPRSTLPSLSDSIAAWSDDHEPTSLQPAASGTTTASRVFSITA